MSKQKTYTDEEIAQALRLSSGLFAAKLAGEIEKLKEFAKTEIEMLSKRIVRSSLVEATQNTHEVYLKKLEAIELDDDDMGGL